jgi:plasmid stabilization system protein ParE
MKAIWSKEALDDRKQLVRYIAEPDLTAAFGQDDRISEAISLLEKFPLVGIRRAAFTEAESW